MPACIRFLQSRRSGLTRRTKISIMIFYQYAYFIIVLSYLRIHKSLSFMVQILVLTEHKWSTLSHPNICCTGLSHRRISWSQQLQICNALVQQRQHQGIDNLVIVCPVISLLVVIFFLIVTSGQADC